MYISIYIYIYDSFHRALCIKLGRGNNARVVTFSFTTPRTTKIFLG